MRRARILAALAALAVIALPAVAQGYTGEEPPYGTPPKEPHLYANGSMVDELNGKTIVLWGVVELTNNFTGPVKCKTVGVGHLANELKARQVEGKSETYIGPGKGHLFQWRPFECVGPETNMEINANGEWINAELVEPKGGPAKLAMRGLSVMIRRVSLESKGTGELQPDFRNDGISIGSAPEEAGFGGTNTGELTNGIHAPSGYLKLEGFGSQELLTVKTP